MYVIDPAFLRVVPGSDSDCALPHVNYYLFPINPGRLPLSRVDFILDARRKANPLMPTPREASVAHVTDGVSPAPVISIHHLKSHCQTCNLRELCLPVAFTSDQMDQFDALVVHRTKVRKHASLYRSGDPFHSLYAIRNGTLKTMVLAEDGREQVMGYHMLGEVIGFDGIGTTTATTPGQSRSKTPKSARLPFNSIEKLARTMPTLQHNLHQMMSTVMTNDQSVMLLLGSMRGEERLAVFLLDLRTVTVAVVIRPPNTHCA